MTKHHPHPRYHEQQENQKQQQQEQRWIEATAARALGIPKP